MKRLFIICFIFVNILSAEAENLYDDFIGYSQVKIFLNDVSANPRVKDVKVDMFRTVFKKVAESQKNIKFIVVEKEGDADVIVNAVIKKYDFHETVFPSILSMHRFLIDLIEPKSVGVMVIDYRVNKISSLDMPLFYRNLKTEVRMSEDKMIGEMGIYNALWENIDRFMYKTFYKKTGFFESIKF